MTYFDLIVPSAPPTNIKATRPQFLTIKITWNAIPADNHEGVLYYALFYKKTDSDLWKKLVKTKRLYYTHKNLEESYYQYKVYGETGAGYGPSSAEITLMPILPSMCNSSIFITILKENTNSIAKIHKFWQCCNQSHVYNILNSSLSH